MNTTLKRSLAGMVFLAVMVGGLLWNVGSFAALMLFAGIGMLREFFRMTVGKRVPWSRAAAYSVFLLSFLILLIRNIPSRFPCPPALAWLVPVWILLEMLMVFRHADFKDNAYILAGLLYIGLPVALSPFVVLGGGEYSGVLMLAFFILIWASDTGAYCFGMLLGQKLWPAKLCPEISPKKSWAGAVGGMLSSLAAAWVLTRVGWLPFPMVHVLLLAALLNVAGVFGDLFESLWKRQFGVKDSGRILPGHGGLLDRFDSSLFAIPVAYVYLLLNGLL